MIRKKDIQNCYNNYGVGEKVRVGKPTGGDKLTPVDAVIIEKYNNYALVQHDKMRWCVAWIDIINNK